VGVLTCSDGTSTRDCPFRWAMGRRVARVSRVEGSSVAETPSGQHERANQRQRLTPQARGRVLAAQGKKLWTELRSVKDAAVELMARYPDVPGL
jgi:hypothetical protein